MSAEPLGLPRRLLFWTILLLVPLLVLELGARLVLSLRVGPSVLLHGTGLERREVEGPAPMPSLGAVEEGKHTVKDHDNRQPGYSKYFPNQRRVDTDRETGESFRVSINASGFRGADFPSSRTASTLRVVTLGASSTFGYYNRDADTYPAELARRLAAGCPGRSVEVLNLGIPHLTSDQIRALFFAEALALEPDVVTFYEGMNDAVQVVGAVEDARRDGPRFVKYLRSQVPRLAAYTVSFTLLEAVLRDGEVGFPRALFERKAGAAGEVFVGHLAAIESACGERGIGFVAATQQAQSVSLERSALADVRYAEEIAQVEARGARTEELRWEEIAFLAHDVLMEALVAWTAREQLPLADARAAMDHDRSVLVSWVHLSPEGNRRVAESLAQEILPRWCD